MAHLTPTEILARAKEFLQGTQYAVQNENQSKNFKTAVAKPKLLKADLH